MEPNRKVRKQGLEHFIKFVRELPVLAPKKIFAKLDELYEKQYRSLDVAERASAWLARPDNAARLAERIAAAIPASLRTPTRPMRLVSTMSHLQTLKNYQE